MDSQQCLLLEAKDVDALYDCLELLSITLDDEMGLPWILIAGSLLGATRQGSLLFCDDDIDIAILGAIDYEKVMISLKSRLGNQGRENALKNATSRVDFQSNSRLLLLLVHLTRFANAKQLTPGDLGQHVIGYESLEEFLGVVGKKDNGLDQPREYIDAVVAPCASFPLYHYDNRKAIELFPKEFFLPHELFPVRRDLVFGHLKELPGPQVPLSYLQRAYGDDCFSVYIVNSSHLKHSTERAVYWSRKSSGIPPLDTPLPLEDAHYAPVAHSRKPPCKPPRSRQEVLLWVEREKLRAPHRQEQPQEQPQLPTVRANHFGASLRVATHAAASEFVFTQDVLETMEPHIAKARKVRLDRISKLSPTARQSTLMAADLISHDHNIPKPAPLWASAWLCAVKEEDFNYDTKDFPLGESLAKSLGMECDLTEFHVGKEAVPKKNLLAALLDESQRLIFQRVYNEFVLGVILPNIASLFKDTGYYYQLFPCVRCIRPGEFSIGVHCDMSYGFQAQQLNFVVPLTLGGGSSALYMESRPGLEDWHPVRLSYGSVRRFWGSLCLHWTSENTTASTRVSLDFRVCPQMLFEKDHDQYTRLDGYYAFASWDEKEARFKGPPRLETPDYRTGLPF